MSKLASQAAILSIARIANYGLMAISPILLVRILPVEQFGRYREFLVYTSLISSFAAFGINDSLLYFIAAHADSPWKILRQTAILVACMSAGIVGIVVVLDLALRGALIGEFLFPIAIYVLLYVNIDFWEWYWLANHRQLPIFLYTAGRLLARMIVVVSVAATTGSVIAIVRGLIVLEALRLGVSAITWKMSSKGHAPEPATSVWREQLRYCMPWGIAGIVGYSSRNLGNIAVVKMLGAVSLAHYTIGLYGEPILLAVRNSISSVLLPEMVRRGASSTSDQLAVWQRATIVNCVILFPIGVLLVRYAEPIVLTVFGEIYRSSIPVLQIYALVMIRECFDLSLPLRSASRTVPLVRSGLVSLIVNAACLIILVPAVGIIGAAIALAVAGYAEAAYQGWCVTRLYKLDLTRLLPWRGIVKVSIAALAASCLILSDLWTRAFGRVGVLLASLFYLAAFWTLLWRFRLQEVEMLWQWARRALRFGTVGYPSA